MSSKNLIITLLLSAFFFASACRNKQATADQEIPEQYLNLDSLVYYNPYNRQQPTKFDFIITKYLNVSCPNCVKEIRQLSAVGRKMPNCKIQLVCQSEDKFLYFKYRIEEKKFSQTDFPFLLDTANLFPRKNPELKMDLSKVVIITDPKNKVLKIVDLDEKIIEKTIKELRQP